MTTGTEPTLNLPPPTVWIFQLPDGHWEIRFSQPDPTCNAVEYRQVKS